MTIALSVLHNAPLLNHEEAVIGMLPNERTEETESGSEIPEGNPSLALEPEHQLETKSRFWRFRGGWRTSVTWGIFGITLVLVVNVASLALVYSQFSVTGSTVVVYEGTCAQTSEISTWCHLTINVLSTLMLGASNYGMQCLSAPTRPELNLAHRKNSCLVIGLPNIGNLLRFRPQRFPIWSLLAITSVSLHFLYNSVIFTFSSASDYTAILVAENFVEGGSWNASRLEADPSLLQLIELLQTNIGGLTKMSTVDCIKNYKTTLASGWGNLLFVTNSTDVTDTLYDAFSYYYDEDSLQTGFCGLDSTLWSKSSTEDMSSPYLGCRGTYLAAIGPAQSVSELNHGDADSSTLTTAENEQFYRSYCEHGVDIDSSSDTPVVESPIDHCLAQPRLPHCQLILIPAILWTVVICNFLKILCLLCLLLLPGFQPLITVGDTISSFLTDPDPWTYHGGPVSRWDVHHSVRSRVISGANFYANGFPLKTWKTYSYSWFRGASRRRWISAAIVTAKLWVFAMALLLQGMYDSNALFSNGLHATSSTFTVGNSLAGKVMVTNTPQVLFSLIYLFYNSLFTGMLSTAEINSLAYCRKPLRVSHPQGAQRSTYYLQLPYRYAIPLMVLSGLLHWLISQTVFLVNIAVFDTNSVKQPDRAVSACGWSASGLYTVLIAGLIMVAVLVGFGSRKYHPGMPLTTSCSRAISAACHPAPGDDDAPLKALMYGVIHQTEDGHEYVGFSSHEVKPLKGGRSYGRNLST